MGPYLEHALKVTTGVGPGSKLGTPRILNIPFNMLSHSMQRMHSGGVKVLTVSSGLNRQEQGTQLEQEATVTKPEAPVAAPKRGGRRRRGS
jgi:hypothetical protein